jgi:hypothetical protein
MAALHSCQTRDTKGWRQRLEEQNGAVNISPCQLLRPVSRSLSVFLVQRLGSAVLPGSPARPSVRNRLRP